MKHTAIKIVFGSIWFGFRMGIQQLLGLLVKFTVLAWYLLVDLK